VCGRQGRDAHGTKGHACGQKRLHLRNPSACISVLTTDTDKGFLCPRITPFAIRSGTASVIGSGEGQPFKCAGPEQRSIQPQHKMRIRQFLPNSQFRTSSGSAPIFAAKLSTCHEYRAITSPSCIPRSSDPRRRCILEHIALRLEASSCCALHDDSLPGFVCLRGPSHEVHHINFG
jgi:hypothetical protein